jgi:uncharacterized membrane protein
MKPLIVLSIVFACSIIVTKIWRGRYEVVLAGRIALSVMLLFTAMAHFAFTKGMEMMLPSFIPYKTQVVYLTGLIEIAAAIGILIQSFRIVTATLLIVFFLLILPSNIYAAVNNIDYQKADFNGNGLNYLWFRIPLQVFFIVWTYVFAIKYQPR